MAKAEKKTKSKKANASGTDKKVAKKKTEHGVSELTLAALQRILYRSNVHRASKTIYEEMRNTLDRYLIFLTTKMVIFTEYENRKTVYSKDLIETMTTIGTPLFASNPEGSKKKKKTGESSAVDDEKPDGEKKKKVRAKQGVVANRKIKDQQNSEDFCFPKTVFERIVRSITKDINNDLKFSAKVFYLLQVVAEKYLVNLCRKANEFAREQKRETLFSNDLTFVMRIESMGPSNVPLGLCVA